MIPVSLWRPMNSMPENLLFEMFEKYSEHQIEQTRQELLQFKRKEFKNLFSKIEKYQFEKEMEVTNI